MKFNKVVHLDRNNPGQLYRLNADQIENSSAQKDPGPCGHQADHQPEMHPFSKEGQQLPANSIATT